MPLGSVIDRRNFLVGAASGVASLCACSPPKPAEVPENRILFTAPFERSGLKDIEAFTAGVDEHYFVQNLREGSKHALVALERTSLKRRILTTEVGPIRTLALSAEFVWFVTKEMKFAMVSRRGGPLRTFFEVADSVSSVFTADDTGAYVFRSGTNGRDFDLVHISEQGELRCLAPQVNPRQEKIVTIGSEVIFYNRGRSAGRVAVAKTGSTPRTFSRPLEQEADGVHHRYRSSGRGVYEIDPSTGEAIREVSFGVSAEDRLLGRVGNGLVFVTLGYRSAHFGSRSASPEFSIYYRELGTNAYCRIQEPRVGRFLGSYEFDGIVAWASSSMIGEVTRSANLR